jgi:hypothetical protein
MKAMFSKALLVAGGIGTFIIGIMDLIGYGVCGTRADYLSVVCWGTRILRSVTGWPTNIAAAVRDFLFSFLIFALLFVWRRDDE